jgi:hypothetical protein
MERSFHNSVWHGVLAFGLLGAPGAVLAADNGVYLGLASSDVSFDVDVGSASAGDPRDDRGFKGIVGFRPLDSFAIEANYVDLGEAQISLSLACVQAPCPTGASVDAQAVSVSAVGLFTLPLVDLFARVGYSRWQSEQSGFAPQDRDGRDPTYGAGLQLRVGSFALRAEYERFELDGDDVDLTSIGFTYTLL